MSDDILHIDPKEPFPEILLDYTSNSFLIAGTCYPENIRAFFDPLLETLLPHLDGLTGTAVRLEVRLTYFNSGAARLFMNLFAKFEECAQKGNDVTVLWSYDEGDDNMAELAEDFEDDFSSATFKLNEIKSPSSHP